MDLAGRGHDRPDPPAAARRIRDLPELPGGRHRHQIGESRGGTPPMVETIEWPSRGVVMIDQPRLPLHEEYVTCRNYQEVATAIRDMVIRGAPAIGVAAAMGVAIGVQFANEADLDAQVDAISETLAA